MKEVTAVGLQSKHYSRAGHHPGLDPSPNATLSIHTAVVTRLGGLFPLFPTSTIATGCYMQGIKKGKNKRGKEAKEGSKAKKEGHYIAGDSITSEATGFETLAL